MKIKKSKLDKLYEAMKPYFEKLYQDYKFLGLTVEEFNNILKKEIILFIERYGCNLKIANLKIYLELEIEKIIQEKINSPQESFKILNNFINEKFYEMTDLRKIQAFFRQLGKFVNSYNFIPDYELLMNLINDNKIVRKSLKIYIDYLVKRNILHSVYNSNNEILISLVEIYCSLHNIVIEKSEDLKIEDIKIDLNNPVKVFFSEIGKLPLLNASEERELAFRIKNGDKEAEKKLIESNLLLVASIAKRYSHHNLSFFDFLQEGSLGLIKAASKFDPEKGYRFSTYATWWIRQEIVRAIFNKSRMIRIPVYVNEQIMLYKKIKNNLEKNYQREITTEEIAKVMNKTVEDIAMLAKLDMEVYSTNALIGDDHETELVEFIVDTTQSVEEIVLNRRKNEEILNLLEACNLSKRELDVIVLRFGLIDGVPETLETIGKKLGITRQAVKQIETKAIRKIRNSECISSLAQYTEYPEKSLKAIDEIKKQSRVIENPVENETNEVVDGDDIDIDLELEKDTSAINYNQSVRNLVTTIYDYFPEYTMEEVDSIFSMLDEEDKELIKLRYGSDLKNPVSSNEWNNNQLKYITIFCSIVIPKMKKILKELYSEESKIKVMGLKNN